MLNLLIIAAYMTEVHELVSVALMPVVEYLLCSELAMMMLLLQK